MTCQRPNPKLTLSQRTDPKAKNLILQSQKQRWVGVKASCFLTVSNSSESTIQLTTSINDHEFIESHGFSMYLVFNEEMRTFGNAT